MIYLDNAATSFPKPESVYAASDSYLRWAGNPGRGAHQLALQSGRTVFETRTSIAEFLGAPQAERLNFTPSCTYSINMVLNSFPFERGDIVFVTALEHNSVMRTLTALAGRLGISVHVVPYANVGILDLKVLSDSLKTMKPKLCTFVEASNVTGERIDLKTVAEICHKAGVPLLVDAAQSAGTARDFLQHPGITFWAAPGHKGLMGAQGVGLLYSRGDHVLSPLVCGGTGSASEDLAMPDFYPDRLEAGTLPGPAIAALGQGVDFVQKTGVIDISAHEHLLATQFREFCRSQDWLSLAGNSYKDNPDLNSIDSVAVVSFSMSSLTPDRIADQLDSNYGIAVRPGLHCAALAHKTLGTSATGLVRASFGFFNTIDDVSHLCTALTEMHQRTKV